MNDENKRIQQYGGEGSCVEDTRDESDDRHRKSFHVAKLATKQDGGE